MHSCADRIIDIFSGKMSSMPVPSEGASTVENQLREDENLLANPAKFCYAFKQAAREAIVGKCRYVCEFFVEQRGEIMKEHNKPG